MRCEEMIGSEQYQKPIEQLIENAGLTMLMEAVGREMGNVSAAMINVNTDNRKQIATRKQKYKMLE